MAELDPKLVHLEVDLYWAYTAGVNLGEADPLAFANEVVRTAPLEVRQYHVKDRHGADAVALYDEQPGDMADLGTGLIDFPSIFAAAGGSTRYYVVEHDPRFGDPTFDPFEAAEKGFAYLDCVTY